MTTTLRFTRHEAEIRRALQYNARLISFFGVQRGACVTQSAVYIIRAGHTAGCELAHLSQLQRKCPNNSVGKAGWDGELAGSHAGDQRLRGNGRRAALPAWNDQSGRHVSGDD